MVVIKNEVVGLQLNVIVDGVFDQSGRAIIVEQAQLESKIVLLALDVARGESWHSMAIEGHLGLLRVGVLSRILVVGVVDEESHNHFPLFGRDGHPTLIASVHSHTIIEVVEHTLHRSHVDLNLNLHLIDNSNI